MNERSNVAARDPLLGEWRNNVEQWPRALPAFTLDAQHVGLVIIDMQSLFLDPTIGMGLTFRQRFPEAGAEFFERLHRVVVPNTRELLQAFREANRPVIFTTVGPEIAILDHYLMPRQEQAYKEERDRGVQAIFSRGAPEHAVASALAPRPDEIVLNKITASAFTSTGIDQILRNLRLSDLLFAGVATDACVELTARDAADRGYKCVLVEDSCAAYDAASHIAALRTFARTAGLVMATQRVLALLAETTTAR